MKKSFLKIFIISILAFPLIINSLEISVEAAQRKIIRIPPKKPGTTTQQNQNNSGSLVSGKTDNIAVIRPKASSREPISASLVTKDPDVRTRTLVVSKNQNINKILLQAGFNQKQIDSLIKKISIETGFVAANAKIGQPITLVEKMENNKRKLLAIKIPTEKYNIVISKNSAGYIQIIREGKATAPAPSKSKYFYKAGTVQTTFVALGDRLGVPTAVTNKAIRVLSGKINTSQIKRGDRAEMLYEYTYNKSGAQTGLRLLYINLISKGVRTEGFRFSPDGKDTGEFFDANGNSYSKSMLASPLKGKHRITSGFGYRRHPILGRRMFHSGVDFGGRRGEPVYAAGDGTIDKIGRYGGYGNYIRIKHDSTWSTAYAHMSGYARGVYKWKRVKKGDHIGYLGSTGRSTGPHLHFELIKLGHAIDPLKAQLPAGGKKLIGRDLYNFRQETRRVKDIIMRNKR